MDFREWNPSKLGDEGLVIVSETIEFKDVIPPGVFTGVLSVVEERKSTRGNYHVKYSFSFNHGKHRGHVRLCFIPSKQEE